MQEHKSYQQKEAPSTFCAFSAQKVREKGKLAPLMDLTLSALCSWAQE